ncbi:Mediator of RNA polymerase II transcription subunit 7-like protein [Elsinoe fawcettii]|nr:Mediator of RNA polymerase II transcription subunit 7-like protein [Elsinoe fawcettii]
MAEQAQAAAMKAPFPDPPPYFKHFTKENLSRLRDMNKSQSMVNGDGTAIDNAALPDDLRYLVPPEPPADGKYKSFGLNQPDISLESAGITQIYPNSPASTDPTPKLIALSRAILLNFLELVGIISNNPEESAEKIEDLQTLFYNAHDLINQYRPHQARESLILMMEEQLARAKTEIKAVQESKEKLGETLKAIKDEGAKQKKELDGSAPGREEAMDVDRDADTKLDLETKKRHERFTALWDAVEAEIG